MPESPFNIGVFPALLLAILMSITSVIVTQQVMRGKSACVIVPHDDRDTEGIIAPSRVIDKLTGIEEPPKVSPPPPVDAPGDSNSNGSKGRPSSQNPGTSPVEAERWTPRGQ